MSPASLSCLIIIYLADDYEEYLLSEIPFDGEKPTTTKIDEACSFTLSSEVPSAF